MRRPDPRGDERERGGTLSADTTMPVVLTIAGSDSGGGAGIQVDLKTWHALGVFGASAITCVTAQNPEGVRGVEAISPSMVVSQIDAVRDAFPVAAAKTGMLYSAAIIEAVAAAVRERPLPHFVVDPVMVATSGSRLLRDDAVRTLMKELLPLATVITPNVPEAEILSGQSIHSVADLKKAGRAIAARFHAACIAKGGHLQTMESEVVDVLVMEEACTVWTATRVSARETHGTGCTFSAALTAYLARGLALGAAGKQAQDFVAAALKGAVAVGPHWPLAIGSVT